VGKVRYFIKKWFNWELCGKSIEPLFSKAPLVEMLLIAPLRPYSIIIFSEKIRAIYLVYQGLLRALGEIRVLYR
jgi:hypothetical protein